jgi:hypothetical protein
MNLEAIANLIAEKTGERPRSYGEAELRSLAEFLEQPAISQYLQRCLPVKTLGASDVRLLSLEAIELEMAEGAAPGSFLRPYGYIVVATSVGGNAICFHASTEKVFWADHVSFASDCICFKDRTTGQWKYLYEYSPENVQSALVQLSEDIETFLTGLLGDRLTNRLEALDN